MWFGSNFWAEMHGASTHFPIALMVISVVFDGLAFVIPKPSLKHDFQVTAYFAIIIAALMALPAIFSGLFMTHGSLLGHGALFWHHLFVWPAFAMIEGLAAWRVVTRNQVTFRGGVIYLVIAVIAAGFFLGAGYWGGELILNR